MPFLAPRFIRARLTPPTTFALLSRCAPKCAGLQRPTYATMPKAKGTGGKKESKSVGKGTAKRNAKSKEGGSVEKSQGIEDQFRDACTTRKVDDIMKLYPELVRARRITQYDGMAAAQAIHVFVRNMPRHKTEMVTAFAMQMVSDIQTGALPPHPWTNVHLLGIFKDCQRFSEGQVFWSWLNYQDNTYVSPAVYGAAMEMLSYGQKATLAEQEKTYVDALRRFPGIFREYHLSPNAIIPDRTRHIPKSSFPAVLFQGIVTARIHANDWKSAYLDIDTGLRLLPDELPDRFFALVLFERPLPEAYTAFLIACRSGVCPDGNHLGVLMKKIREAMKLSTSLDARTVLLRALANAIYAYFQVGGKEQPQFLSSFLTACAHLLPTKAPGKTFEGEEAEIRDVLVSTAHEVLSMAIQAGLPAGASSFSALFTLARNLHVSDLLRSSLRDAQAARIDLGPVERRAILHAAGRLAEKEVIEEYWNRIVSSAEDDGEILSKSDWVTFARACLRASHDNYCREQMHKLDHTLAATLKHHLINILKGIDDQEHVEQERFDFMSPSDFSSHMEHLKAQFTNIAAVCMTRVPLDMHKSPFYTTLDPDCKPLGSIQDMRTIYDEMTTDPHQPAPAPDSTPTNSRKKCRSVFPLDELRFLNWCSINQMMDMAQTAQETSPTSDPPRDIGDVYLGRTDQRPLPLPLDELRSYIKSLRTLNGPGLADKYTFPDIGEQSFVPTQTRGVSPPPTYKSLFSASHPRATVPKLVPSAMRKRAPVPVPKRAPRPLRKMPVQSAHVLGLQPAGTRSGHVRRMPSNARKSKTGDAPS